MRRYHDDEWGRPVHGDQRIFERLSLEGFQSGLSWLTILRKRDNFRAAFAGFDPGVVAEYAEPDVRRLLDDAGIVRHRGKIEAVIANAGVLRDWQRADGDGVLDARVWACADAGRDTPVSLSELPTSTAASVLLARDLKRRGWRFLGPTTAYAALQAIGVVNDHLAGCHVRRSHPVSLHQPS
ncbi:MAG: DNA-3-methyladenine glycosylase I [Candidatus Nanopelagicales bacterium]|jgi:DNA-3-methyladenine glycosylase I